MIQRTSIIVLFIGIFLLHPLAAQPKTSLTIEQAIQIGMENSKALRTSQYKVQAADAKAAETNTLSLPAVKFAGAYTRLSDVPPSAIKIPAGIFGPNEINMELSPTVLNNYTVRASIQQPLFTGWKISGAIEAADHIAAATKEDFKKDKADVVYNIRAAYWNLFRAIEFKKFVDENVNQIKAHATDAEHLVQQGMLTTNDAMKVKVQLSDALVRQIDASNNVKLSMYVLNNTLGLPLQSEIVLASSIQLNDRQWDDVDQLIGKAFQQRPDMMGMEERVKAGESGLTAARGSWYPQVFLSGNYNYLRPNQRIFPTKDEFKDTWDLTLSVSFDVWNWGQTGYQTTQAQAQLAQALEGRSMLKDGVMLDVTQNYLAVNQSKERKAVAEQGVTLAAENYKVMNDKFKKGLTPNSELLDAEVALLQARLNLTQSLVDYELSMARLSRAVGE
jgi:outer membrane protein TolC